MCIEPTACPQTKAEKRIYREEKEIFIYCCLWLNLKLHVGCKITTIWVLRAESFNYVFPIRRFVMCVCTFKCLFGNVCVLYVWVCVCVSLCMLILSHGHNPTCPQTQTLTYTQTCALLLLAPLFSSLLLCWWDTVISPIGEAAVHPSAAPPCARSTPNAKVMTHLTVTRPLHICLLPHSLYVY